MACSDIIILLTNHGFLDYTLRIDSSKCPKLLLPVANGGISHLFSGPLRGGPLVAIKKFRTQYDQALRARVYDKRVAKEIHTWSECNHPNILTINRVAKFHEHLAIITDWEDNGSLLEYLSHHPSVDRYQLSTSICAGLAYLHGHSIIHGSLKGTNVLISQDGAPMLMDFGMGSLRDLIPQTNSSGRPKYLLRWTPPEIYEGRSSYTMSGDIYSLGMSCIDGDRLWAILKKCWSYHPGSRPSAEAVRSKIDHKTDRQSSEEVRSGMETENVDPEEHLSTAADWSNMQPISAKNPDPTGCPSTGAVLDGMQTIRAKNLDVVGGPSSEAIRDEVETIRAEHRKKAGGKWQNLFCWK
ncbi:unnamed protein product [Rhizoctonia solani]|uniref:Protein kinase domain-containing protein n=1 Tax=Rhizoctonia solani TaxID=456999 RepID=A0A8H3E1E1_9AGAM|nr:unnamed protein product [Rhizoctonia solani]